MRLGIGILLAAVAAWGLFTWALYNPLQSEVASLERMVPSSVGWVVRGSGRELLASPFVKRFVLDRPEARGVLDDWKLSALPSHVERFDRDLNTQLPGFLAGFSVIADVFGSETVVFGVTDMEDVTRSRFALATRLSPRARAMVAALKHAEVRRRIEAGSGLRLTRTPVVIEVDTTALVEDPSLGHTAFLSLVRDVLVAGNDRDLVLEAARLGRGEGTGSLADRADAKGVLADTAGVPLAGFVDLARLAADLQQAGDRTPSEAIRGASGMAGIAGMLIDPVALTTAAARVTFPADTDLRIEVRAVRGDAALDGAPAALADAGSRPAAEALAEAAALAPAGSAWLAARVEAPAGTLLRLAFGRTSGAVRDEIEKALREKQTSLDGLARDADDVFLPGASLVVERLPDCDDLALDQYGAGPAGVFVYPLPGVLVALRQRPGLSPGTAERFVRRIRSWGEFRRYEDLTDLEHGMTGLRAEPKFLTGDMALVKPAAVFDGDLVLLSSNEGLLRRALEARAGRAANLADFPGFAGDAAAAGEGQAAAFVEGGALLAHLRDQRREVATDRGRRDWVLERRKVRDRIIRERLRDREQISEADIQPLEEEEMQRLVERNRTVEFQDASAAYLRELAGLRSLRAIAAGLAWNPGGADLRVVVRGE